MTRYIDTDPDIPDTERTPGRATCLLCGIEATTREVWLKPAWWREGKFDEAGRLVFVTTVPRCLDSLACRARCEQADEVWPLLEHGEDPNNPIPTKTGDPS